MNRIMVLIMLFILPFVFSCNSAPKEKKQEVSKESEEQKTTSGENVFVVYFAPNSATIDESIEHRLDEVALILKQNQVTKITIAGHSAKLNTERAEERISLKRAIAVGEYFRGNGLFYEEAIEVEGKGAQNPSSSHSEISERWKNRRVEISY